MLHDATKRFSVSNGVKIATVVSVKDGMVSKAAIDRAVTN